MCNSGQSEMSPNSNTEPPSEDNHTYQAEAPAADGGPTISHNRRDDTAVASDMDHTTVMTEKPRTVVTLDVETHNNKAPDVTRNNSQSSCLTRLSAWITLTLEEAFERHGRRVASHPLITALLCVVITALCALGSFNFYTELRPYRLWIPQDSEFIKVLNWQVENFPSAYRKHFAIWEADNVLTASVVQEMWRLHNRISELTVGSNHTTWENVCARVPSLPVDDPADYPNYDYVGIDDLDYDVRRRRRDLHEEMDDLSLKLPRDQYCDTLITFPSTCLETSLLEIWGLNEDVIMNLTDEQVIEDVNSIHISKVFGYKVNFTKYLGSMTYDEAGQVVSAKAATHIWVSLVNQDAVDAGDMIVDQGSGELVDTNGFAWEKAWVATVLNDTSRPQNVHVYAQAASSFGTISDENIWGDVQYLMIGFIVMSIFVNMMLGRRDPVQQRSMLAALGMGGVGMAVAVSYGLCSVCGVAYCPVNSILPILMMGLGVDDMFVILAAWEAAGSQKDSTKSHIDRAGQTMRHAGVAITVTSLTDVTAFAVGATTDLPALRSFCIYAAVGIFAVYVLQATFFLAWLVQDEKRMEKNRNGFFWFITHKNWTPWSCSQRDLMVEAFKHGFCRVILSTPACVVILFGSGCLLASSAWATMNLRQEFNPMWFIPQNSYLYETFEASNTHFPEAGEHGYVYFANVTLPDDLPQLLKFTHNLTDSDVVNSVDAWFTALNDYILQKPELINTTLSYSQLQDTLSVFLHSSSGAVYRNDFVVDGALDCHFPAPPISSFRIGITHQPADSPAEQSAALSTIKSLVASVPISGYKAAWSQAYSVWETNEVVGYELWRNIFLAGAVVGLVTLVLLASFPAAMLVLGCVGATILGVSGSMWLWGLTVDTVSCIALVLAIGLSVDYAAHVAHSFLTVQHIRDRKQRVTHALERVGPAILQGGLSTLLSFILLAESSSHVFQTFFKVFTVASILGLYYGLVLLPVVLSLVGPAAYTTSQDKERQSHNEELSHTQQSYINTAFSPDQYNDEKTINMV